MAYALVIAGVVGIIGALVLVKMGYGRSLVGAVSKGSRMAVKAVTKGLADKSGKANRL